MFQRIKRRDNKGAMTVEAALVFPLFVFAFVAFLHIAKLMYLQEKIHNGICEVAKEASSYGYIVKDLQEEENRVRETVSQGVKQFTDGAAMKIRLQSYVSKEEIEKSCIKGGWSGISLKYSSFMREKDKVEIVAVYNYTFPLPFFHLKPIKILQRAGIRAFVGTYRIGNGNKNHEDNESEEMVYVTHTGTVYHYNQNCSHLKLTIFETSYKNVGELRNAYGGKYKSCEKCVRNKDLSTSVLLYIAKDGDKYHLNRGCSGLKRTIYEVPLSSVEQRQPCSRCGY